MSSSSSRLWTCSRCLRVQRLRRLGVANLPRVGPTSRIVSRGNHDSSAPSPPQEEKSQGSKTDGASNPPISGQDEPEQRAMSRRLTEMAEETIDTGSKSDRKLMRDVGFSDELKQQLEERIAQTSFAYENQKAASEVNMPTSAGKGSRDMAAATPWTGSESIHDSALRMLDDSHKRLRSPHRPPSIPQRINLRPPPKKKVSAADRLVNARDKTSIYASTQQGDMSEKERERWRKELKERFTPGARPMPTSLQGLASLANERIEDAIARGQFKNIPRGKGTNVERDYNANSPFLDTTEYFMNKIIQKQEIVPPWIEKQQDLVKTVANFRGRLRNDWRRHAARTIASAGGSIEDQVLRARRYALAEEKENPRVRKVENLSSISSDGSLTSITVEERIAAGVPLEAQSAEQPQEVVQIKVTEEPAENTSPTPEVAVAVTEIKIESENVAAENLVPKRTASISTSLALPTRNQLLLLPPSCPPAHALPIPRPSVEKAELAYHTLAIQELNTLTRSYNLMAPKIAQKPYYTLARELDRCFADVAPQLADQILERSRAPAARITVLPHRQGGVLERFGHGVGPERYRGHEGRIRDEIDGKGYGFRELWRDLFRSSSSGSRKQKTEDDERAGSKRTMRAQDKDTG